MRVLVVDDEETVRTMLDMVLGMEDIDVTVAADGDEALVMAQLERPDVIVLDIMMPRVDGWTVADSLRADPELRDIPIVFCSALTSAEHVARGFEHGAAGYVLKPFHTDDLVGEIHRAAGGRRQSQSG
jgi:two-component system sensor histidine kinase/response regulator